MCSIIKGNMVKRPHACLEQSASNMAELYSLLSQSADDESWRPGNVSSKCNTPCLPHESFPPNPPGNAKPQLWKRCVCVRARARMSRKNRQNDSVTSEDFCHFYRNLSLKQVMSPWLHSCRFASADSCWKVTRKRSQNVLTTSPFIDYECRAIIWHICIQIF